MTQVAGPIANRERHWFVDALRGFSLLGILIVNIEYIVQPAEVGWAHFDSPTDTAVRWFIVTFGQTKIYPIFALLFGYGLSLQLRRAHADLWSRHRRRMLVLIVLGSIHGALFFPGDILSIYGLVGLVAYRFRDAESARLVRLAAIVYGTAAAIWLCVGVIDWFLSPSKPIASPDVVEALTDGSFVDVTIANSPIWVVTQAFLVLIQGPAVFASFFVGIALGRTTWLADPSSNPRLVEASLRLLPGAIVIAGVAGWLTITSPRTETLGFALGFAVAPAMAAGYIAVLSHVIGSPTNSVSRVLQTSGRMSLTVYLLESVVTGVLAFGYGFGLLPSVGPLGGLGLAVAIWSTLSVFAVLWMATFRFGPLEWVLRTLSYGKPQPLLQQKSDA